VKMQKCKTKHINIYMSFLNRPNLMWKAKNETKITHMNHSIVKALPQVLYENTSMWQSKIFRFKQFYQKKARFTCKGLSMSHLSHCWRWKSVNLAMSLPSALAWVLYLIHWY
jgi:hypothetical protein